MEDGQKGSKLLLSKSSDQGKTWSAAKFQVNDKNTGNSKGIRLGDFGIAIDSGNNIHISWDSLSLTYEISNWYRKYSFDTKKLILRPENTIDLNKIYNNGIRSKRTGSAAISIDKDDIVWLTMGGSKRWLSKLLKSEKKMASNMKFKSLGDLATNYSTQSISLELANNGNPIWTFYRNSPPGEVWLSYFDKVKNKINSGERLGNTQSPNDYLSQVCTDSLGGIHTLVYKDTAIKNKHSELVYRLYDPVLGFGQEITIFKDPNYNVLSNSQANSFAIGCMQKSGDVFVVYRDFSKNAELVLSQKKANQFKFNQIKTLAPKSKANNAYLNPSISGSLWPKFNRSETSLLISWQELKQGFYSLNFERVSFAKGANNVQPN